VLAQLAVLEVTVVAVEALVLMVVGLTVAQVVLQLLWQKLVALVLMATVLLWLVLAEVEQAQ
jgi:hypothetical protein